MTSLVEHEDRDAARDSLAPRSLDVQCSVVPADGGRPAVNIVALSRYEHETHRVDFEHREYGANDFEPAAIDDGANTITSRISDGPCTGLHTIALDVDVPVRVVPSSTPGHAHLYIDRPLDWRAYVRLLDALTDAGVIERGFVDASRERGCTRLRLPWIKKPKGK